MLSIYLKDGYHLTRAALSAMPSPLEAHARRGAPFTFDPVALKQLVLRLKAPITPDSKTIFAPSFDHAKKDPVEDDIAILTTQRILVFEGFYPVLFLLPFFCGVNCV